MLTIENLTYRIGGRLLLERASLALPAGHHAGLVGRNGTGKTTLLKLIAGELHADTGEIRCPTAPASAWSRRRPRTGRRACSTPC